MTGPRTEGIDYGHATLLIEAVLGESADADDLITKCLTAVGRILPDLDESGQARVLAAVQVIVSHWIDSTRPQADSEVEVDALPRTVRRALTAEHAVWVNGDSDTCLHGPTPDQHGIVYVFAWRPFLVVCAECRDTWLHQAPTYCFACGNDVTPGTAWTVQLGPLIFATTLCETCNPYPEGA